MLQVKAMSSHQCRAGTTKWTSSSAAADELAVAHLELEPLAAVGALGARRRRPCAGRPGSRARPRRSWRTRSGRRPRPGAASRRRRTGSASGSRSCRARARARGHRAGAGRRPRPRPRRARAPRRSRPSSCARPSRDEGRVDVVPDPQVELVHGSVAEVPAPVKTIAAPALSTASITSRSRFEPPGWMKASTPASSASRGPSGKGKNASEASEAPSSEWPCSCAFSIAIRTASTRLIWPAPIPIVCRSLAITIAFEATCLQTPPAKSRSPHCASVGSPVATSIPSRSSTSQSRSCTSRPPSTRL